MARNFNGSTHRADNDTAAVSVFPFSLGIWFNADVLDASRTLICILDKDVTNHYFALDVVTGGEARLSRRPGGGETNTLTTNTIGTGTWQTAVAILTAADDVAVVLAGDWANRGTSTVSKAIPNNVDRTSLGVLGRSNPAQFFDGLLAYGCIWTLALNENQVNAFQRGVEPWRIAPTNLVRFYPVFGLDSPEPDYSGNKEDLTLTGPPTLANHPPVTLFTPKRAATIPLIEEAAVGERYETRRVRQAGGYF